MKRELSTLTSEPKSCYKKSLQAGPPTAAATPTASAAATLAALATLATIITQSDDAALRDVGH